MTGPAAEALARQTSRMGTGRRAGPDAGCRLSPGWRSPGRLKPGRLKPGRRRRDRDDEPAIAPARRDRGSPARHCCLYPSAWRARYGDEVIALIEDTGAARPPRSAWPGGRCPPGSGRPGSCTTANRGCALRSAPCWSPVGTARRRQPGLRPADAVPGLHGRRASDRQLAATRSSTGGGRVRAERGRGRASRSGC